MKRDEAGKARSDRSGEKASTFWPAGTTQLNRSVCITPDGVLALSSDARTLGAHKRNEAPCNTQPILSACPRGPLKALTGGKCNSGTKKGIRTTERKSLNENSLT